MSRIVMPERTERKHIGPWRMFSVDSGSSTRLDQRQGRFFESGPRLDTASQTG